MFFVYILYSKNLDRYYIGQTNDIDARLDRHNAGKVSSTRRSSDWKIVHIIECNSRSEAMILEKKIKGRGAKRFLEDQIGM